MKSKKIDQQPFINAFLIHQRPYLEKKLIVHLFTAEHGLIAAITHQSKKKRERLQLFTPLSCQVLVQTSMCQLKQVECTLAIAPLHGSYLFAGLYINELIYKLCQANQGHSDLYALYQHSLQQLSQRHDLSLTVRTFEYHLQCILGYSLNYDVVYDCDNTWFSFDPEQGLKPSISGGNQHFQRQQLLDLAAEKLDHPQTQQASKQIFSRILKQLLGDKSLFISQMLPKSL